jgi:hypothetical protein
MIYNLKEPIGLDRYNRRSKALIDKGALVNLTESKPPRSNQQNRYLHLIIGFFAMEYGESLEYVKTEFFKLSANSDLFKTERVNRKTGEIRPDLRSTSDLDTKEMTQAIDSFRTWASKESGIYLPSPNETEYLKQIMTEMDRQKEYL